MNRNVPRRRFASTLSGLAKPQETLDKSLGRPGFVQDVQVKSCHPISGRFRGEEFAETALSCVLPDIVYSAGPEQRSQSLRKGLAIVRSDQWPSDFADGFDQRWYVRCHDGKPQSHSLDKCATQPLPPRRKGQYIRRTHKVRYVGSVSKKTNCRIAPSLSLNLSARVSRATSDEKYRVRHTCSQMSEGVDSCIDALLSVKSAYAQHHRRLRID